LADWIFSEIMTRKTPTITDEPPARRSGRLVSWLTEAFGLSRPAALAAITLTCVVLAFTIFWFFYSAGRSAACLKRTRSSIRKFSRTNTTCS
jgi:hypothetical protein